MSQIMFWPLALCKRMSCAPSLLKSPIPPTFHPFGTVGRLTPPTCLPLWMNHSRFWPLLLRHKMLELPVPSKLPVPATYQSGGLDGSGGVTVRNPSASMHSMSTVVSWPRLPTISSNGSFGVRLEGGFDPGPRKSLGSEF